MSAECITHRTVCTLDAISTKTYDWEATCNKLGEIARSMGYSTANCVLDTHYLRLTDLKLQGIGEVDSRLLAAVHSTLNFLKIPAFRIHVGDNVLLIRCHRPTHPVWRDFPRTSVCSNQLVFFYAVVWLASGIRLQHSSGLHGDLCAMLRHILNV
jgi:hypothetical protein